MKLSVPTGETRKGKKIYVRMYNSRIFADYEITVIFVRYCEDSLQIFVFS